jgi:hypothetical protein
LPHKLIIVQHPLQELSAVAAAAAAADDDRFAAERTISKLQLQVQQLEQQLSDVQQIAAARPTELLTARAESSARHEEVSAAAEEVCERSFRLFLAHTKFLRTYTVRILHSTTVTQCLKQQQLHMVCCRGVFAPLFAM